jgi:hypothetical protein
MEISYKTTKWLPDNRQPPLSDMFTRHHRKPGRKSKDSDEVPRISGVETSRVPTDSNMGWSSSSSLSSKALDAASSSTMTSAQRQTYQVMARTLSCLRTILEVGVTSHFMDVRFDYEDQFMDILHHNNSSLSISQIEIDVFFRSSVVWPNIVSTSAVSSLSGRSSWNENCSGISEDVFESYSSWYDMEVFQRYHYLACIASMICNEQQDFPDEPNLDIWCFQFMLVALLEGPDYIVNIVQSMLQPVIANSALWLSRYVFSGGMVRNALIHQTPSSISKDGYKYVCKVVRHLIDTRVSDWEAFFEQYENFEDFKRQAVLRPFVYGHKLSRDSFIENSVRQGLFSHIDRIDDAKSLVYIRWIGCPKPIPVRSDIKDPKIVLAISQFRSHIR